MKSPTREFYIAVSIVLVSFIAHSFVSRLLAFNLVAPLLAATLFSWTLKNRIFYLGVLALLAELTTTLLPGILVVSIFFPLLVWRFRQRITVDLSFSYLLLMMVTAAGQLLVVLVPGLVSHQPLSWPVVAATWVLLTLSAYATSIAVMDLLPTPQRSIISLEGYRINS